MFSAGALFVAPLGLGSSAKSTPQCIMEAFITIIDTYPPRSGILNTKLCHCFE